VSKTLENGSFQDAVGTVVNAGTIEFVLSHDAMIIAGGQVAPTRVTATLDSSGDMPSAFTILANDELTPSGTFYLTTVFDSNGARVFGPERWVFSGATPIDLDTLTPTIIDPAFANPVLQDPSAAQTITGFGLTTTSTAPLTIDTETVGLWNKVRVVDGTKFAQTGVGIQAAIDDLPAAGGTVFLPEATYSVAATITIVKHNVFLVGVGSGLENIQSPTHAPTRIQWTGASGSDMIRWGNVSADRIAGGGAINLELDAADIADRCLHITEFQHMYFERISCFRPVVEGITLDQLATPPTEGACGHSSFHKVQVWARNAAGDNAANGLGIRGTADSDPNGITQIKFYDFRAEVDDGFAIVHVSGDGITFFGVDAFKTGSGSTIRFAPDDSTEPFTVYMKSALFGSIDIVSNLGTGQFIVIETHGGLTQTGTGAGDAHVWRPSDQTRTSNRTEVFNHPYVVAPLEAQASNVPHWIMKQVDFGDMTAAATADTFTLWSLPTNTMIHDIVGTVVTAWAGGSISAAVASVGTNGGAANDLTLDDNFFGTGARYELHDATANGGKGTLLFDATDKFAPHFITSATTIEIQMDLTGDNHVNATAGRARIYALVSRPFGNSTLEAN